MCSVVDVSATLFILLAFKCTTLTSVMIIEDFTIPTAVVLSLIVLKTRYEKLHFIAIGMCIVGISLGFLNDFLFAEKDDTPEQASRPLLGDFFALCGAFFYALENIL